MKLLTVVRHAKSSWKDPKLSDLERPLNKRGLRDAPGTARRFAGFGQIPDRILSSPSIRTVETARILMRAMGIDEGALLRDERIYVASHARLFELLRAQPDAIDHLMLVGHSPGVADLGHALCGVPGGKFPTCAVLHMRLSVDSWKDLEAGDGEVVFFDTPKEPANRLS